MKRLLIIFISILSLLGSCKKDDVPSVITPAEARDTLYYIMRQWYYWYNLMPSVTKENYADPYLLLEAMRYKELDRWSFVADYDEFIAEMEGTFVGHGIRIGLDENKQARIALIYNKSPLYSEGVRRGWIVEKVNNTDLAPIMIDQNTDAYNALFGASNTTVTNTFLFKKPDGTEVTIISQKASFTINTVLLCDTLQIKSESTGQKIVTGHLVLESFIEPTETELATAFAYFKSMGVKDLILDLRYNSGGYLTIARQLASYIAGSGVTGTAFATLKYNSKNLAQNQTFNFISSSNSLSLSRLVVITTRLTASASECLMNGLDPHLTIVSVGDTTNGKPTGMNGWSCGKKYFFWPITFETVNSLNIGGFYEGFIPDKLTTDDITHDFTDKQEKCYMEAIHYIAAGSFSTKGSERFRRSVQFSEKPSWMNNTFVLEK